MNNFGKNLALWVIIGLLLVALFNLFQQPSSRSGQAGIPYSTFLAEVQSALRQLASALIEEVRAARASGDAGARIDALASASPRQKAEGTPVLETGSWEFTSSRDPSASYLVKFGRAGHLECTCPGFTYRGNCKHTREVREQIYE